MASFELDLITLAILLILSGIFSGTETAIVSLSRIRVKQLLRQNKPGATTLANLKKNPQRLIITILIGNNIVNIAAASLTTTIALEIFPSYAIGIAVGFTTFLILVFGEITPKSLALQHGEFISLAMAKPLSWMSYLLSPVIWLLEHITTSITHLTGAKLDTKGITEDELRTMVAIGAEEGTIRKQEKEYIHKIFKLDDLEAWQIMTPRTEVTMLHAGTKLSELASMKQVKCFSRIPVYKESVDDVIGILYVKDALLILAKGNDAEVSSIVRPAHFIPRTKKLHTLLKEFQNLPPQIAVVVDEYGGVEGIVTLEDVLEELVGEITDETDVAVQIKKINDTDAIADARATIGAVNQILSLALPTNASETIGGLLMAKLDKVPVKGERVQIGQTILSVEDIKGARIISVKITNS